MESKGTIRFELRKDSFDKKGKCNIRLVYQVKGTRRYFSTGSKVIMPNWDFRNQRAIYIDKIKAKKEFNGISPYLFTDDYEIKEINNLLSEIVKNIHEIEIKYKIKRIIFNTDMVINCLKEYHTSKTKSAENKNELIDFISDYISQSSHTRVKGSLSVYKALLRHLKGFNVIRNTPLNFTAIDIQYLKQFQNYLVDKTPLKNTTIAKQLSTLKTILNYAKSLGYTVSENYRDFKIKRDELEVVALTQEEFELIYDFDFSKSKKYQSARDLFCFSCSTGLRYSDIKQLKREHIYEDEIRIKVIKTRENLSIPLNKYSREILIKYSEYLKPLPTLSNQKLNKHIKEICQIVGINDSIEIIRYKGAKRIEETLPKYSLITAHTGRRTFVTLSLEKGMNAEEVKSITGHKDYKSFSRYVKVTENRKKLVMQKAWDLVNII
jgi:integrase